MNKIEETKFRLTTVGKWEKKIKYSGMTISEISRKANICRGVIYNAIQGKTIPTVKTINKVEEVLKFKTENNNDSKKRRKIDKKRKIELDLCIETVENEEDIQLVRDSIREDAFYKGVNEAMLTDCEAIGIAGHCSKKCPVFLKGECKADNFEVQDGE